MSSSKPHSLAGSSSSRTYFLAGLIGATAFGALANIPMTGAPSTAIVPEVSEIRAKRHEELSFDRDLKRLSDLQGRYRENLPRRQKKASARPVAAPAKIAKRHGASRG